MCVDEVNNDDAKTPCFDLARICLWRCRVALAVFVATLDQDKVKKYISAGVSKATGRQLSINGDLKLDLGWISRVTANQIQFANAELE